MVFKKSFEIILQYSLVRKKEAETISILIEDAIYRLIEHLEDEGDREEDLILLRSVDTSIKSTDPVEQYVLEAIDHLQDQYRNTDKALLSEYETERYNALRMNFELGKGINNESR